MRVRYSVLADASGSFGGLVASHNRAGQYIRTRVRPTNPSSPAQVQVRTIFANLATAWSTLTEAQREAWTTYALNVPVTGAFGEVQHLTGHQMFVRNNAARMQGGLDRVDDGPTTFAAVTLSHVFLTPNASPQTLDMFVQIGDPWTTELGGALLVYATRQSSPSVLYRKNPFRFVTAILGPFAPPAPRVFLPSAPFAMSSFPQNAIFTRFVAVSADGRLSHTDDRGPTLIVDV